MISSEKSYLAGFLDGDGSIYVRMKPNHTYRYNFQVIAYIAFFQSSKSRDAFCILCDKIGCGKLRTRKDGILEYVISRQDAVYAFLNAIEPYLILKRDQAKLMRKILSQKSRVKNEKDFKNLMTLIDSFRELNYSKNRKKRTLTP